VDGLHLIEHDLEAGPEGWLAGELERLDALLAAWAEFHDRHPD
jgi:hypothetical protein